MKKTVWLVLAVLAVTSALLWWLRHQAAGPVPVGILAWRIPGEMTGSSVVNAGVLFPEEHPDSPVAVVAVEGQETPGQSAVSTAAAIEGGIDFFITAYPSSFAVATRHLFQGPEALAIVAASTTPELTGKDDFIFRVVADAEQEQRAIARHIHAMPGDRLLVVQDDGNAPYTDPAFQTFSAELSALGKWHVVRRKSRISAFRPDELEPVMAGAYDMLYILAGSYQPAIGTVAQLFHHLHPRAPIVLTPWARSRTVLGTAGPALSRIVLPSPYPSRHESRVIDDYYERFQTRFGFAPYSTIIGVRQAVELFNQAFAKGHRTPEQVKEYLLTTPVHRTSLGPVAFDRFGDVKQTFHFLDDLERELQ